MSVLGTNHQCVLGGKTSKEWTAKNKKNNWSCSSTGNGFICQNCNRFSCHTCAKKLLNLVKKEAKGYIETNSFCTEIEKAIQNNVQPTKCHSCWMDKTEIDRTFKNTIASGRNKMVGDGMLWLPEFSLLIDSPMINYRIVDIHGFGKELSNNIPADWHSVIAAASAEALPLSGTTQGRFH